MSNPPEVAPDLEPTQLGGPPPFTASSADMADRFAVLRDPPSDDHERANRRHHEADATRYEFGETFARGGLGRIRRAYDRRLQRFVAVKELQEHRRGDSAEARFAREALITARLEHPSIIPIHDVGAHDDGEPYYCMKLVEGRSLEAIVRTTPALAERLALLPHVLAVADALAYAHDRQVVHRDLKPSNVLVGPFGETVVIDWGLAKDLRGPAEAALGPIDRTLRGDDGDRELTHTGELLGTLPYMPLEQAEGHDVGPPADVYAAGALLYFLLSGRPPYDGRNATAIYHQILATPPPDISQLVPDISPELAAIVRRAMARAPTARYASARELAEDLRRLLAGHMVAARAYSPMDILRYFVGRHRTLLGTVGTSFVLLLALGIFSYVRISRENAEVERQRTRAEDNLTLAVHKSAEAEQEARRAKDSAFTALLASGRHLLFDQHQPQKALPILNEAYKLAPDDRRVKRLLGEATIAADSLLHDFALPAAVTKLRFDPTGDRLLAIDNDGALHIWNLTDGRPNPAPAGLDFDVLEASFTDTGFLALWRDELIYIEDGVRRWRRIVPRDIVPFDFIFREKQLVVLESAGVTVLDMANGNTLSEWRGKSPVEWTESPIQPSGENVFLLVFSTGTGSNLNDHFTALRWDTRNSTMHELFDGDRHNLHSVAVSPDGRRVSYVIDTDDGIKHFVADASTSDAPVLFDRCEEPERNKIRDHDAVFSPDGRQVTRLINNHHLVRWDIETRHCVRNTLLSGDNFNGIRASVDGRTIVAQGRNGTIAVLDGETLALRRQFMASTALLNDVVLSPDASTLATGDSDGHIRMWDLRDPRIVHPYPVDGRSVSVNSAPMLIRRDGEHTYLEQIRMDSAGQPPTTRTLDPELDTSLFVSTDDFLLTFANPSRMTVWSLSSGKRLCVDIPLNNPYHSQSGVVSSADEIFIIQTDPPSGRPSDGSSSFETIDVTTCRGESFRVRPAANNSTGSLNVERALLSSPLKRGWYIVDTTTGDLVAEGPETWDEMWRFATLFPDGRKTVVSSPSGGVWILDTRNGLMLAQLNAPNYGFSTWIASRDAAFFTPDGATFITPSPNGPLDVWDTETWEHRRTLQGHVRGTDEMVFSDDSTRTLSFSPYGFGDANVFLWDIEGDHRGIRLDVARVTTASFNRQGDVLATGTRDGVIYLWDTASGEMVDRLEGDSSDIKLLRFSEDGQYLLGSSRSRVIVWNLPYETRTTDELDVLIAARDLDADR